jgi:hypothetical protein
MRVRLMLLAIAISVAYPLAGQNTVPVAQKALYTELSSHLQHFLESNRPGESRITFAAELLPANGNRGEALLTEQTYLGTVRYLDRLQKMGLKGVTIQMPYPLLSAGFPRTFEYWAYYRRLAAEVRRRGLVLLVKSGPVFTQQEISPVAPDYSRVSWDQYLGERTNIAARIVSEIQPDYLTIANEPATEASVLGKSPLPPARYVTFIRDTLQAIRTHASSSRTHIGAGSGSWDDPSFVRTMIATPIDYVDIHIYPLASRQANFLDRARTMARSAKAAHKRVIIGEFWLYKASARELGGSPVNVEMFGRDTFGFWSPLDARMFEAIGNMAAAEGIEFVSAFWSKYFFASLDYERFKGSAPGMLLRESDRQAVQGVVTNTLTDTGRAYQRVATR